VTLLDPEALELLDLRGALDVQDFRRVGFLTFYGFYVKETRAWSSMRRL
jgi:hypothetical protein